MDRANQSMLSWKQTSQSFLHWLRVFIDVQHYVKHMIFLQLPAEFCTENKLLFASADALASEMC